MSLKSRKYLAFCAFLAAGTVLYACESSTDPDPIEDRIHFDPALVELGDARAGTVEVINGGTRAIGPITLVPGTVTDVNGAQLGGARLISVPDEIPTLTPGASATVVLSLDVSTGPLGDYGVPLDAQVGGEVVRTLGILFTISASLPPGTTETLAITGGPTSVRQGDVVIYTAETRDSTGALVADPTLNWTVLPLSAGHFDTAGRLVGYEPGAATIIAFASGITDTLEITIDARNGPAGTFIVVGQGLLTERFMSDLWVFGDYAYTGTWNCRSGACGDRLLVWNVSNPATPLLTDEVLVDARTVNDVKVSADGAIAVITHEASSDGQNGVTLLSLADPANPSVIRRFTSGLESGVHNVWIEGNYVYVAVDGVGNGMRVLDITNPSNPSIVASYYAGSSFLHDIYVRDGLAFLSHWNAGLVILDVGNGVAGGSPSNPVEVGRIETSGGQTHNAWYWPAAEYVFVGEEDLSTPGIMHVVDVSDLQNPEEVATFRVPGTTPHNFWLDESRGILYLAWYENGIRALDVSGALLGELDKQGREIAWSTYSGVFGCFAGLKTCTWAPQLHGGNIFVSDLNTGLWVLQPTF